MLIESRLNSKKWLWVNIPKTATTSTMKAIFPDKPYNAQEHYTYHELIGKYGTKHDVFTMVRNPIDRFMSGLNHIFNICECGKCKFDMSVPPKTEEVISFIGDMLLLKSQHTNFFNDVYKNNTNNLYIEVVKSIQKNFLRNIIIDDAKKCIRWSLVIPQSYILDGMENGRIYKYEDIETFNIFMRYSLGYALPEKRYRQYVNQLTNVDKSNTTLKQMLYEFHKDDFINYEYSI